MQCLGSLYCISYNFIYYILFKKCRLLIHNCDWKTNFYLPSYRQLDLNLPRKLSTQEIFATFSDSNCASAFQKFQPNIEKSESISEDTQAVPMETSLVYPLFSNGYKQSSYNVKEISIFKKIF